MSELLYPLLVVSLTCVLHGEEAWDITHSSIVQKNKEWNKSLPGCDFTNKSLFERMLLIQPRQERDFAPIGDAVFSESSQRLDKKFLSDVLNGELLVGVTALKLSGYCLSDEHIPSILLYKNPSEAGKDTYSMQISGRMMMITIKPTQGFSEVKGIFKNEVMNLIKNGFKLKDEEFKSFNWEGQKEILKPGTIVTSYKNHYIHQSKSWAEELIVVISSNGVSIIFPKMERDAIRATKGFRNDIDWVDIRLHSPNGDLIDGRYEIIQDSNGRRVVKKEKGRK